MKKKQFYHQAIETESVVVRLQEMELSEDERSHLIALIDSSLHHAILDAVLSELSTADKKLFLKELANDDHDAIWNFLRLRIEGIEGKVSKVADDLKKELHEDINKVGTKK